MLKLSFAFLLISYDLNALIYSSKGSGLEEIPFKLTKTRTLDEFELEIGSVSAFNDLLGRLTFLGLCTFSFGNMNVQWHID